MNATLYDSLDVGYRPSWSLYLPTWLGLRVLRNTRYGGSGEWTGLLEESRGIWRTGGNQDIGFTFIQDLPFRLGASFGSYQGRDGTFWPSRGTRDMEFVSPRWDGDWNVRESVTRGWSCPSRYRSDVGRSKAAWVSWRVSRTTRPSRGVYEPLTCLCLSVKVPWLKIKVMVDENSKSLSGKWSRGNKVHVGVSTNSKSLHHRSPLHSRPWGLRSSGPGFKVRG